MRGGYKIPKALACISVERADSSILQTTKQDARFWVVNRIKHPVHGVFSPRPNQTLPKHVPTLNCICRLLQKCDPVRLDRREACNVGPLQLNQEFATEANNRWKSRWRQYPDFANKDRG